MKRLINLPSLCLLPESSAKYTKKIVKQRES